MSEVFNNVLKGAHSLPITALAQFTFSRLNSYFVPRREQGANILTSDKQYTPYVDAQIKSRVVKAGSMEIVLYDHIQGRFHVKSKSGETQCLNLHDQKCTCGKTLIYGFLCSHIIAACQHRCVDFRLFVQATTLRSRTMILSQPCFIPYSMKMNDPFMMVLRLYLLSQ